MKLDEIGQITVEKQALYEQIADKLENMILNDNTQLEQKLPSEQSLAFAFGVSRPVIREALKLLRARGLVIPRNGEGSFICVPETSMITDTLNRIVMLQHIDLMSIFEVRLTLEIMSVRLCAEKISPREYMDLVEINTQLEQYTDERRTNLDIQFHKQIAKISGNSILEIFVESIMGLVAPIIQTAIEDPDVLVNPSITYHRRILSALEKHDPQEAQELMRKHLLSSQRNYEAAVKKQMGSSYSLD